MITIFSSFFLFNKNSIDCLFLGVRFSKILSKAPTKTVYLKILKWIEYNLLHIFFSSFGFLFFPIQFNFKAASTKKAAFNKFIGVSWKIIKKIFQKNFFAYGLFDYTRKKFKPIISSLWEMVGKYFSLIPKYCTTNFNYGENLVDYVQQNEYAFSINCLKIFILKRQFFYLLISKYRQNFFLYFYQCAPEYVFSILKENIFSTFYAIFVKIFLIKSNNILSSKFVFGLFSLLFSSEKRVNDNRFLDNEKGLQFLFLKYKGIKRKFCLFPSASYKHLSGIFTAYYLDTLSLILEYRGMKIPKYIKNKIEESNRHRKQNLYFFQLNPHITIDATFLGNQGRLLNHSCKTNCFTKSLVHGNKSAVFIVSKKIIKSLEELCYDYRLSIDDSDFNQVQCLCYNIECKKELMI